MVKLNEIIEELWEDNFPFFKSKKEFKQIIVAYCGGVIQNITHHVPTTIEYIGSFKQTKKGLKVKKERKKIQNHKELHIRNAYTIRKRSIWGAKFIDNSFE
jgi:nucleoid DNA-binding protein